MSFKTNKAILLLILFVSFFELKTEAQVKQGYPEWPLILRHHSNVIAVPAAPQVQVLNQLVDWKPDFLASPPAAPGVADIPNQSSYNFGPSGAGFDICGNMIFYVGHTGLYANDGPSPSALQLKIFLANGTELTNANTRLDCSPRDNEIQICTLPEYDNRWIIFYIRNSNNDGTGNYRYDEIYYSIFEINSGVLNYISGQKDVQLNKNKNYDYGKALSTVHTVTVGNTTEKRRYLYIKRDQNYIASSTASDHIAYDQFTINQNGILYSPLGSTTPRINSSVIISKGFSQNNEDVATPVEMNEKPNTIKLASVFYSRDGSNLSLLQFTNHESFGAGVPVEFIHFNELAIVPPLVADPYNSYGQNTWNNIYKSFNDFPGTYLHNFSRKIAYIEFSPAGNYLYISHGGYTNGGETVITYLGQIDLQGKVFVGPISNNTLEYPISLKVQEVAGYSLSNSAYLTTGKANTFSNASDQSYIQWTGITTLEKAANNKIYFTKVNSNKLFCISNPDQPFSNIDLQPVDILAADPGNVTLNPSTTAPYVYNSSITTNQADVFYLPDAIDQEEYGIYGNCQQNPEIPCENCIGSFSPTKDKKYVVSLWAREDGNVGGKKTFTAPELYIDFPNSSPVQPTLGPFLPSGAIIDGWQRIEGEFYLPPGANYSYFSIRLNSNSGDCFFDDIRVFPFDASIKTYVYDPITLRLSAELDERNYATIYEYDEEGKLVRVKKETEKGIMTIQENKNSTVKKP